MPIIGCILHLPVSILSAFVSVYQKITIMQQAGKCWLVHIFGVFLPPTPFFPCDSVILKCICLRRKLLLLLRQNYRRPSLAPWLTVLALMLVHSTVPQAQSDCLSSTTLSTFGRTSTSTPAGLDRDSSKKARHHLQGCDSFLLQVTHQLNKNYSCLAKSLLFVSFLIFASTCVHTVFCLYK